MNVRCALTLVEFGLALAACGEVRSMKPDGGGGGSGSASCSASSDCDSTSPYCVADVCAGACTDDEQCPGAGQTASEMYCVAGACVACRDSATDCSGNTPVCDSGACRACTAHSECASDLCDVQSGTCVAESAIAYVDPNGSATSACTKAEPCTIARAFSIVDATRNQIKLASGTHTIASTISSGLTITLYGPAHLNGHLEVKGGTTLRVRDATFGLDQNSGYLLAQPLIAGGVVPTLDLEDVTFEDAYPIDLMAAKLVARRIHMRTTTTESLITAQSSGLSGDDRGSELTVNQSTFDAVSYGVTLANGSSATFTNCVFRNPLPSGTAKAIVLNLSGPVNVSFSTFHNMQQGCGSGSMILTGRNNIFLNEQTNAPADTVTTTSACQHFYSLIKPQSTPPNGANNLLNVDPRFADGASGDYHLGVGSPAIDAADPAATEPVDLEGTLRPQGAGRDLGAFEYKP